MHRAVACAQHFLREGCDWVVDLDLERFIDRVMHDVLMARVKKRVRERRVLASVSRFLEKRLKLRVNAEKIAVDRPWRRAVLGFTFVGRECRRRVSNKAPKSLRDRVKGLTRRTRGQLLLRIVDELRRMLLGWRACVGFGEVPSPLVNLEKWIHRRLRCIAWKQWGRRSYRELRRRGVSCDLAWDTSKSAHGPWRLRQGPALGLALPARYFRSLGLPSLVDA